MTASEYRDDDRHLEMEKRRCRELPRAIVAAPTLRASPEIVRKRGELEVLHFRG